MLQVVTEKGKSLKVIAFLLFPVFCGVRSTKGYDYKGLAAVSCAYNIVVPEFNCA